MTPIELRESSLVLYKNRPARVVRVGRKLEIELDDGESLRVRPKDVVGLHPGPVQSLDELRPRTGEVKTAWELLTGGTTSLSQLAELIYGSFDPATAWATWKLLDDGLYFHGTPEDIEVRSQEEVTQEQATRKTRVARQQAWEGFLERVRAGQVLPSDKRFLRGVQSLALGQRNGSRVLRELGRAERPQTAHALLLELGIWDTAVDPYPQRLEVSLEPPVAPLPALPAEDRLDLTHLAAFAIDDEGNRDPDDALSLDGDRLWVHVADAAALVHPESDADREAQARGANLYLPEGTVPMLPSEATQRLALGLQELSPALSFGLDLSNGGELLNVELALSRIRVTRMTYAEAEEQLAQEPFRTLYQLALTYQARRRKNGAIYLDLPEIQIWVQNGRVHVRPIIPTRSRDLVTEAMLMAGEAAARYALDREIPFPFSSQDPPAPDAPLEPKELAEMYALRRALRRSQIKSLPAMHAGLGMALYSQATSPLRRYMDLVAHQQLRAHLRGDELLGTQAILERIGAAEAVSGDVRRAERLARQHWTMVYLLQQGRWEGEGILVDKTGSRGTVLIPELDLEPRVQLRQDLPLNSIVPLSLVGVDLPELEAHFRSVC